MPAPHPNTQKRPSISQNASRHTLVSRTLDAPFQTSATEVPPEKPKFEPARVRCPNCGSFFWTRRFGQRFDKEKCRKEFHANGAGFGKLREALPKQIAKISGRMIEELRETLKAQTQRINQLEERVKELEARLT